MTIVSHDWSDDTPFSMYMSYDAMKGMIESGLLYSAGGYYLRPTFEGFSISMKAVKEGTRISDDCLDDYLVRKGYLPAEALERFRRMRKSEDSEARALAEEVIRHYWREAQKHLT